jgi:hypothetical protein
LRVTGVFEARVSHEQYTRATNRAYSFAKARDRTRRTNDAPKRLEVK